MSDKARDWTDEQLDDLTGRFERAYSQAADEMRAKLEVSLKGYATENEQRQKAMDDTPEARAEYEAWKSGRVADQAWMRQMVDMLSDGAHNANRLAADMTNDAIPRIYSENANMQAFALESRLGYDVGFTLVNEDAVRYLIGLPLQKAGDDQLLREVTWNPDPERSHVQDLRKREVDYPSDMRWNRQKFTSAITQGILQGESIPNIVKRTSSIYGMNKNAATRAARTSVTNAENAGRMNTFERAQRLGIDMEIEWLATLDGRTRSSHRALDGERIQLGEKFSNGLRWPADPQGAPSEVWNCRCRANGRVVGFDGKRGAWADERGERWTRLPKGMTYDEWRQAKAVSREKSYENPSEIRSDFWPSSKRATEQEHSTTEQKHVMVDGNDILGTWRRRPDEYDFEIEDVLAAQGFDGMPRVVSAEEFDKAVKAANGGNGFIAQRSYSAPNKETLDAYREQLYHGKWYVDCSTGGAQYGQGMYCAADYTGIVTNGIREEMVHYHKLNAEKLGGTMTTPEHKLSLIEQYVSEMNGTDEQKAATRTYLKTRARVGEASGAERRAAGKTLSRDTMRVLNTQADIIAQAREGSATYVETMTLDPTAKIITFEDADKMRRDYNSSLRTGMGHSADVKPQIDDTGSFAALMGYDAINAEGHGASGSYTVVLNRTKLIIRGQ